MNDYRSFRFLWIGQALANAGDVFYIVGIISLIYRLNGSVVLMSLVPLVITFSRFLGGLFAPWVMDLFPLKKVLLYSQAAKTLFILFLNVYLTVLFDSTGIIVVFPVISLIAFLDGWATPARNTMLPRLVEREGLVKANSFISMLDHLIQLGAWPIGGMITASFDGGVLITLTFVLFLISTILISFIREIADMTKDSDTETVSSPASKWDSLKEGWITIWKSPPLKTVALVDLMDSIAGVVWIAAILFIYVEDILHKNEVWWGYINATFFAGLLAGGFLGFKGEARLKSNIHFGIYGGGFLVAALTLWFGLSTTPWMSLLISFLVGVSTEIKVIGQQTVIQLSTPRRLLAKVFSARDAILTGTFGITSVTFGYLADVFGVKIVFVIASCVLFLSGVWVFVRREYLKDVG